MVVKNPVSALIVHLVRLGVTVVAIALSWLGLAANALAQVAESGRESVSSAQDTDQGSSDGAIAWSIELSQETLSSQGGTFYARLRARAPEFKEQAREPLNLALAFDRSASMNSDAKIGYVRKAGYLVADNLTPRDHVALVTFNHEAQTLVPMHAVVNREYLRHRVDELTAVGDTNISGGLLEASAQLQKRLGAPGRHHIILLTDGLANRGVSDSNALVALTRQCARRGISVSTIGVGVDFNESLLTRMAEAGAGRYAYAANADQIPTAVEQQLGALLAVSAQNVRLKLTLPPGVEALQIYGREEAIQPGEIDEPLGDLTNGEERRVLIKFRYAPTVAPDGAPLTIKAELSFDNLASASRQQEVQALDLNVADGQLAGQAGATMTPVLAYARLVEDVDKIALAVKSMDRNLAIEIQRVYEREFPVLKRIAADSHDQDFVNKAFMFEHYSRDLSELIEHGELHDHSQARASLQKDLHYRRYMLDHHQHQH